MSVTLSEVKRAARAHRAPLAGESAGYLVLALADQVLSAPRLIAPGDVQLTDDGGLRVLRGQASSETDAELSLRRALDSLLLVASSGSAALMRAGRRSSPVGLPGLVRELEAALIPVNRAAARRALARLQRETARAVASGTLPVDEPELAEPVLPIAAAVVEAVAPVVEAVAPVVELATDSDELETPAIAVNAPILVDAPPSESHVLGSPSAAGEAYNAPSEDSSLNDDSDALTLAVDVRTTFVAVEIGLLDEDVEFLDDIEIVDEEASDALTVARSVEVEPVASAVPEQGLVDLPEEACTRPEPVILRRALRPLACPEIAPAAQEAPVCTPTLGSLAAELPVLAPELIAEMTRRERDSAIALLEVSRAAEPVPSVSAAEEGVVCSAPREDFTEPMPEVAPLSPGVAIVASRRSDVSELLAGFGVGPDDSHQGLRRAIKELAELDLTPAPFTALIR